MTVVRTGVQQRIKEINPLAEFEPCDNHSLSLLGVHTTSASVSAVTFFGTVQRCFYFFAASTHRWDVLKSNCSVPVKRAVDARWSARKEAVSCLKKVFSRVVDTLEIWQIRKKYETREGAGLLLSALQTFSLLFFFICGSPYSRKWSLRKNTYSKKYLDLIQCASKIRNLDEFLQRQRESLVADAVAKATDICEDMGIATERRIRGRRRMPVEEAGDGGLTLEQELR